VGFVEIVDDHQDGIHAVEEDQTRNKKEHIAPAEVDDIDPNEDQTEEHK